jgi:hypothetical protein
MTKNLLLRFSMLGVIAAVIPAALAQEPIYTTLGAGGTFDTDNSVQIAAGAVNGYADLFTSPVTADIQSVSLALGADSPLGVNVDVALHEDLNGLPGPVDHLFGSKLLSSGPGIVTFDSFTDFQIKAGTQYWLTAVTSDGKANWFYNSQGVDNAVASLDSGSWNSGPSDGPALAFQINPLPEPNTVALCALGIAGLFFTRRLKFFARQTIL